MSLELKDSMWDEIQISNKATGFALKAQIMGPLLANQRWINSTPSVSPTDQKIHHLPALHCLPHALRGVKNNWTNETQPGGF